MSWRFYRGIRCRVCNGLFMDWRDHRRHIKRHKRAVKRRHPAGARC
jgi:hypothetical protein